jgi:two-component system, NtrC family, sensor kinase
MINRDPGQRVIVMTGYATLESAIVALNLGAYAFITKPFNMDVVKAFINQAIRQYELAYKKREADAEIKRLKEYNDNILTSLPYAIIIFDQQRQVEYVNAVYLKDFNQQWKDVIGRNLFDVLPFTDLQKEKIKHDVENFLSEGSINPQDLKIDNRTFGYRFYFVFKGEHEQQKTGLIMRDITAEHQLQQQLMQSEKLAGIGTMAMGIAHEINNPLFGIMGMAEAILDENDRELILEYTNDIIRYSKSAAAIVKGLTIYSRSTESGDICLIDVNHSLDEAVKIAKHSTTFDSIETVRHYTAQSKVLINSGELQQVFVNIIQNAAQAMEGKGLLTLSTQDSDDIIIVTISDTGPGIPQEHLGKVFNPFYTTKDPGSGTGLGLYIIYRIIQKYNGTISIDSEKGKGATFIVTLPQGE